MVDAHRRKRLYRERELSLTHKLAVGDDGDRIYVIDAKKPLVNVYSLQAKQRIASINLYGAPEEMCYPRVGKYYYISVLDHLAVYQLDKATDQIVAAYVPEVPDPLAQYPFNKVKFPAVDKTGDYLFATSYQSQQIYIWEVGNPDHKVDWAVETAKDPDVVADESGKTLPRFLSNKSYHITRDHYLPMTSFKLKKGYRPDLNYPPEPTRIAIDSMNQNVFVTDSNGALFVYDFNDTLRAKPQEVIEPYKIVHEGFEGEMRDLKVSYPMVGAGKPADSAEEEAQ
jgi:DNA-binding beta-propeller fold protein YncE